MGRFEGRGIAFSIDSTKLTQSDRQRPRRNTLLFGCPSRGAGASIFWSGPRHEAAVDRSRTKPFSCDLRRGRKPEVG